MKLFWTLLIFSLSANCIWSQNQESEDLSQQLIIQVSSEKDFTHVYQKLSKAFGKLDYKEIAPHFNLYLIEGRKQSEEIYRWLIEEGRILSVTKNRKVKHRLIPNDELYQEQWALQLIGMENVWDNAKADVSPQGDSIVIAIFDDGYLLNHPDLNRQTWKNPGEIPNDGIDNDQNNYVDDVYGWNFDFNSDEHDTGGHGSPVAGIAGATSNNDIGISGAAFNTRLLPITPSLEFVDIFEGMDYVWALRDKYNRTNGAEGAFIVAANFSFGVENSFPEDVGPWCDLHDSLGRVGILSVGSVTNSSVDVGVAGDIPSLCPSPFLISVTQTNRNDELPTDQGGFNIEFVDLAAPGQDIMSTSSNFDYRGFNGSSAAAPLVSGAIASLYSVPCPALTEEALTSPAQTAVQIKELVLNNTVPRSSLEGRSVTGGRLDVFKAVLAATEYCSVDIAPFSIQSIYPNPSRGNFTIAYTLEEFDPITFRLISAEGKTIWDYEVIPQVFAERTIEVNLQGRMPAGVYMIEMNQNGKKFIRSIVIN